MKTKNKDIKKQKVLVKILQMNSLVVFSWSMLAPFVVVIGQERGMTLQQAGSSWAMYTLICGSITLVAGRLEDGLKKHSLMYVAGIFSMLIASIVGATTSTALSLYIMLCFFAIGFGLANPALKTIYARLQIKGQEASEWAWMDGGNMLIMSAAAFFAAFIAQKYSTSLLFMIMIPLITISLLLGIRLLGLIKITK